MADERLTYQISATDGASEVFLRVRDSARRAAEATAELGETTQRLDDAARRLADEG